MMFFKERKGLEAEFRKWTEESNAECSVFNAITWLVEVKGYRQPEPPKKELICTITVDGEEILRKALDETELDGKTLAEWFELLKGYKQLEASYSQVSKALCDKENATPDEILRLVSQVKAELATVKRERDAAVSELSGCCSACKNQSGAGLCCFCVWGYGGNEEDHWQWRGVCPDTEAKEDD